MARKLICPRFLLDELAEDECEQFLMVLGLREVLSEALYYH